MNTVFILLNDWNKGVGGGSGGRGGGGGGGEEINNCLQGQQLY